MSQDELRAARIMLMYTLKAADYCRGIDLRRELKNLRKGFPDKYTRRMRHILAMRSKFF